MTSEQLEQFEQLGSRAVACKRWWWMPGMRVIVPSKRKGNTGCFFRVNEFEWCSAEGDLPDLSDPATRGCLLALVREAWGDGVYLLPDGGWYVKGARLKNGSSISLGICADTEADALVAALEAAP